MIVCKTHSNILHQSIDKITCPYCELDKLRKENEELDVEIERIMMSYQDLGAKCNILRQCAEQAEEDLSDITAAYNAVREELGRYRELVKDLRDACHQKQEIINGQAERDRYREVLKKIADNNNWFGANEEINKAIAESVFDKVVAYDNYGNLCWDDKTDDLLFFDEMEDNGCPDFSTSWEAMHLVVERMRELGLDLKLIYNKGLPTAYFFSNNYTCVSEHAADTAPIAVCLAALKAVKGEYHEP